MKNLDELTSLMFRLASPAKPIPGPMFTEALSRSYMVMIGRHLGVSDEELVDDLLSPAAVSASDHETLGLAFAAAMLRTTGNAYASGIIIQTLEGYSGTKVSQPVGALLKVLESYLIRNGDIVNKEPTLGFEEESADE